MSAFPKVLIVDDDQVQRYLFSLLAERFGMSATIVSSAVQALKSFEQDEFQLVIMDVRMPGIDGIECTKRLRQTEQNLGRDQAPIIGVSADVSDSVRFQGLNAGMSDFLTKPFSFTELDAVISRALRKLS